MRSRAFALGLIFCLAICLSSVVEAQLSDTYSDWASGPAGFLLTKKESKEWKKVSSDAEAKRFIELFWARRDPNLETPYNEFKSEFEMLVKYADENFGFDETRGALTDRGKVAILLGVPHKLEHRGPTETVSLMDNLDSGTDEVRANADLWYYVPSHLPAELKVRGSRLMYIFYEQKAETNNFVLDRSHPDAPMAIRTLSKAPDIYFLHPDLDEAPKPVAVVGGTAADSSHLGWLSATDAPLNETAIVVTEAGVANATFRPLWVHLQLPADAPVLDEFAGRVKDAEGDVLSTFQIAASPLDAAGARAYHLTFPLEAGTYRVELAGAAGGTPQVVHAAEVEIETIPADGTWLSPLWVGLTAEREEGVPMGSAYTFAGWHLMPLVVPTAPHQSELSYFGYIVRPGGSDDAPRTLKLRIVLKRDGTRLGSPLPLDLQLAPLGGDLYMYANVLNLAAFPEAGTYELEFKVRDRASDVEMVKTVDVTLLD